MEKKKRRRVKNEKREESRMEKGKSQEWKKGRVKNDKKESKLLERLGTGLRY